MSYAIQTLIDAISVGSLYALSALGIGLLFGILRLANFAQTAYVTIGVYALMSTAGLWFPFSAAIAFAVVIVVALSSEQIAFRPIRDAEPSTLLITSFAVSYFLQYGLELLFGARPIGFDLLPQLGEPVVIGGVRIPSIDIVTLVVTAVLLGAFALLLLRTRIGVEMRAAAVDFRMARLLGVRADRVIAIGFAISGVLAATVAVLLAAQTGIASPTIGLQIVLVGFVATVIGGMGSLVGAALGGLVVGAVSVGLQAALPPELRSYREAFVYAVVIAVLIFRPQGLFRSAATRERV